MMQTIFALTVLTMLTAGILILKQNLRRCFC